MVRPFFPNLKLEDLGLHQTGIRAKLKDRYDFVIEKDPVFSNVINLVGMDSPALSASLAVAKYVKELLLGKQIL
jgi:glycine/D-amino acid oxidase-like deaminating enzyme